jgi:Flp pilus assembly protein protease CpaA
MTDIIQFAVITAFLIIASVCDITTGKIKNWLTFPALIAGLTYTFVCERDNLQSTLIFLAAMFALGCIGLSGWGDIKCIMALASLSDWKVAAATFVGSQVLLFVKYLVLSPKQAAKDVCDNAIQISERKVSIDRTKEKHLLAPFLLASYFVVSVIFHFIR